MSTSRETSNGVQPRERDWNEVRAEITRLVEAVSALTLSMKTVDLQTKEVSGTDLSRPKARHNIRQREWVLWTKDPTKDSTKDSTEDSTEDITKDSFRMFYPAEEVSENLLDVLLSVFLRTGSGQALLGNYASDLKKYDIPTFTDQLRLRLAMKIQTQDASGGTHDFDPSKLCLVVNQLKAHLKSTG